MTLNTNIIITYAGYNENDIWFFDKKPNRYCLWILVLFACIHDGVLDRRNRVLRTTAEHGNLQAKRCDEHDFSVLSRWFRVCENVPDKPRVCLVVKMKKFFFLKKKRFCPSIVVRIILTFFNRVALVYGHIGRGRTYGTNVAAPPFIRRRSIALLRALFYVLWKPESLVIL